MRAAARLAGLSDRHPCLGGEAHSKFGRIHLPVSRACNIRCLFCRRDFNAFERRPGVAAAPLAPEDAVEVVERALELCPEITVVGVAGPGDALASDDALVALGRVHARFPDLIKCLSTNGLVLARRADEVVRAGVATVTLTVNSVDPATQARLCAGIVHEGRLVRGETGARILIDAQLEGIRAMADRDIVVKVNTVLVPRVNEDGVREVARRVAAAGSSLINIIPLIPEHELAHLRPPTCVELSLARAAAEEHLPVFRHCRRCRADAVGVPGRDDDFGGELFVGSPMTFSHG